MENAQGRAGHCSNPMDIPTVRPRALRPGDSIGVIAPAGPIQDRDAFDRGIGTFHRLGFKTRFDERVFQSRRYLAGEDAARAEELMKCFEDPDIHAVFSLRGGYGSSRLISLLDARRLRTHCKLFMGFSDLTTLHLYFRRRFGWITVHGPMAASPTLANLGGDQERHLLSLCTDPGYRPRLSFPRLQSWHGGVAEGKLVGGCLSLVVASLGTPYEIRTEGEILFLEDLEEPPYRVDRMLTQLQLAGKLETVAGLLLGTFHECVPKDGDYTVEEILQEILCRLGVPILANFPAGHGPENWAIPLGVPLRLDADNLLVEFLEPTVVSY